MLRPCCLWSCCVVACALLGALASGQETSGEPSVTIDENGAIVPPPLLLTPPPEEVIQPVPSQQSETVVQFGLGAPDSIEPGAVPIEPGHMTELGAMADAILDSMVEPNWRDAIADDNSLLWREHKGDWEILPRDSDGVGFTTINFSSNLGMAVEDQVAVWLVPRFGWTFVSGPNMPDVDPQLYDLRLELNFAHAINDIWGIHLQLAPTFATDWDNKGDDALRIIGGGMLTAKLAQNVTLLGGALYLDRPDLPVLPVGGIRWLPADWVEITAAIPSPKFAVRYAGSEKTQHWVFLGGQLGGGSWAIDHTSGLNDRLSYRDLRVVAGLETRKIDGTRTSFEAGYVFDRHLDFQRFPGDQKLGGTAVIRWGSTY